MTSRGGRTFAVKAGCVVVADLDHEGPPTTIDLQFTVPVCTVVLALARARVRVCVCVCVCVRERERERERAREREYVCAFALVFLR